VHYRAGREEKLRYVFLTPVEEQQLRALEGSGVEVTAQDVPSARAVPLAEVLDGESK
jgi:mannose/fructose/N-acetylgalactosamine-specific phosphotransferase system component IIB